MKRRKLIGTLAVLGAGSGVALTGSASASSTVSIQAQDIEVDDEDGKLDEVYIDPELEIEWENMDTEVTEVRLTITTPSYTSPEVPVERFQGTKTVSSPGTSGTLTFNPGEVTIEEFIYTSSWAQDGMSTDYSFSPTYKVELIQSSSGNVQTPDSDSEIPLAEPEDKATLEESVDFTVTVNNLEANTSASGETNPGANG